MKKVLKTLSFALIFGIVFCSGIILSACGTKSYIVDVYCNTTIVSSQRIKSGKEFDLDAITYEGYAIEGVYDNSELEGEPLSGKLVIKKETKLYLKCAKLYYIEFKFGTQTTTIAKKLGESVELPEFTPEKTNARFLGWCRSGETQIVINSDLSYTIKEDDFVDYKLTLEPLFEEKFEIKFDTDGGLPMQSKFDYAGNSFALQKPTKIGNDFVNWIDEEENTYTAGQLYTVSKNATLKAQWTVHTYTLRFNADGQSFSDSEFTFGQTTTLPTPQEKEGYYFRGWNLNNRYFKGEITVENFGNNHDEITFEAGYEKKTFIFRFVTSGDDEIQDISATFGDTFTLPTIEDENFVGWEFPEELTLKVSASVVSGSYTVEDLGDNRSVIVLTAKFSE